MVRAVNRRLGVVRSQLRDATVKHTQARVRPPAQGACQNAARGIDTESVVAARSVSFLASLVRAQTDVEEGEPCPGEVAVQRAISKRLTELGASVTDM